MFADLVDSTRLAARLDPEDLKDTIGRFQRAVADEIRRFEGHVAKPLGDGLLIYFGWPPPTRMTQCAPLDPRSQSWPPSVSLPRQTEPRSQFVSASLRVKWSSEISSAQASTKRARWSASAPTLLPVEAGAVAALYRDVSGFPEPDRSALQADLREYTRYEMDEAWVLHRQGIISPVGMQKLWLFQDKLQTFEPKNLGQQALYFETLRAFNDLIQKRSLRLDSITSHLPRPLWRFVIVGAVLSFAVSWFFQPKDLAMHLWMTAFFAVLLGLEIHLLFLMDNPYRGSLGVTPEAFRVVYDMLMR